MQQDTTLDTKLSVTSNTPKSAQGGQPVLVFQSQAPSNLQIALQQGPILQSQFSLNKNPQSLVSPNQIDIINQNNNIKTLETRIYSGFGCYTCLVYWELLVSLASVIFFICIQVQTSEIVLTVLGSVTMILGCILALFAKSNFDSKKQMITLLLFCFATLLSVLAAALSLVYIKRVGDNDELDNLINNNNDNTTLTSTTVMVFTILAIPEHLIIGLGLIWNAQLLTKLMRERDNLIVDISTKTNNAMLSARF